MKILSSAFLIGVGALAISYLSKAGDLDEIETKYVKHEKNEEMYNNKLKKIGSATYLNKINGMYIPFRVWMRGTNCNLIQPMLN